MGYYWSNTPYGPMGSYILILLAISVGSQGNLKIMENQPVALNPFPDSDLIWQSDGFLIRSGLTSFPSSR